MSEKEQADIVPTDTYYVDEAGDGVLFGPQGGNRLADSGAPQFFMLGMVRCTDDAAAALALRQLRKDFMGNPLFSTIYSMQPEVGKTAKFFHAKDDHADVRTKVFELLVTLDFKFYAVVKDMRAVQEYVLSRNRMHTDYRYQPNELYDLTVRMLFKHRLHKDDRVRITFARHGKSDRTAALQKELDATRQKFLDEHQLRHDPEITVAPAYPWEALGLQISDYCLWALQRCYERHEARFLAALWSKVSIIHDVDDPDGKSYGTYLRRTGPPPDAEQIKNRRIWVALAEGPQHTA